MGILIHKLFDKETMYIKLIDVLQGDYCYFIYYDLYDKRNGEIISSHSQMIDKTDAPDVDENNLIKSLYPYIHKLFTSRYPMEDVFEHEVTDNDS